MAKNLKEIMDLIRFSKDEDAIAILEKMAVGDLLPLKKTEDKRKKDFADWIAPDVDDEEKLQAIQELIEQGYSEREAHREVGTHKEHSRLEHAMRSGVGPSIMSDKRMAELGPLIDEYLANADRLEKEKAEKEKNPMLYAAGRMQRSHEDATAAYNKDYHEYLNRPDVKSLKGRARHQAIKAWKEEWKKKNPDYEKGLSGVSDEQKTYDEARQAAQTSLNEKVDHIAAAGVTGVDTTSVGAAAKGLGLETKDDTPAQPSTEDMTAAFAAQNPRLISVLQQEKHAEKKERMDRVNSHKKAAGQKTVIRRPKKTEGEQ